MRHKFPLEFKVLTNNKNQYLVVFPNDPSVIWIEKSILDILGFAGKLSKSRITSHLSPKYTKDALVDAYKDLEFLKKAGFLKHKDRNPWTKLCYSRSIRPNLVRLHLTHRCNLNCSYCYSLRFRDDYNESYNSDMDWPMAKKIIDWTFKVNKNSPNPYINFMFFGGEPLLNLKVMERSSKYIKDQCEKNRSKTVGLSICTNGTLIDKKVARMLKKYNIVTLVTVHNKDRAAFRDVMEKKLGMLKKFLPKSSIIVTYIINNKKDIKEIEFLAKKIKGIVQKFAFDLNLKDQDLRGILEEAKRFTNRLTKNKNRKHASPLVFYGNFEGIESFVNGIKAPDNCGESKSLVSFFPDGRMRPCSVPLENQIYCPPGNINNQGMSNNKITRAQDRSKSDCMKCWTRSYCKGMCKYSSKKASITEGENLLCDANRFFMEHLIKWYSGLSSKEILNVINQASRDSFDIGKHKKKYEKTKLVLHFRDLLNKKLRYARLITPVSR